MECCFGALNTKGFISALNSSALPQESHITYSGLFNQVNFSIGPKAKKPLELYLGYARAQNQHSLYDAQINNYLTIFTKGNKDGEDRDDRSLNSVIILDISGSMGSGLTSSGQGCRIQLAKQAILMFYSKLRPSDAFGLVVFNNQGTTILPVRRVSETNFEQVSMKVRAIQCRGGTTLMSGFHEAHKQLKKYLNESQFVKNNFQNRLIMLTDVCDNSISQSKNFVSDVEETNLHTTIIGISDEFQSQVCESLIQVKGFNYFCATEIQDLKKYLFENFSYTFFPANYDIEIVLQSEQVTGIQVFGTVDADKVQYYNNNATNKFVITKTKSSFPSELQITQQGEVKTYGGLMLIKLKLKNKQDTKFDGRIKLEYKTSVGYEKMNEQYELHYQSPPKQQFFSEQSLYEAISIFNYGFEAKNILRQIKSTNRNNNYQKYTQSLQKLREQVPTNKKQELQKLIEAIKKQNENRNIYSLQDMIEM